MTAVDAFGCGVGNVRVFLQKLSESDYITISIQSVVIVYICYASGWAYATRRTWSDHCISMPVKSRNKIIAQSLSEGNSRPR